MIMIEGNLEALRRAGDSLSGRARRCSACALWHET